MVEQDGRSHLCYEQKSERSMMTAAKGNVATGRRDEIRCEMRRDGGERRLRIITSVCCLEMVHIYAEPDVHATVPSLGMRYVSR